MAKKIESGAAAVATAALGGATGFAALMLIEPMAALPVRSVAAACFAAMACLAAWRFQAAVDRSTSDYRINGFELSAIEPTAEEGALESREAGEAPLVLDDVLQAVGPDARVVRLFDASAMPTPAQLKARVDQYLGQGASWAKSPDASQALVDALTELRRSLR